MCTMFTLLKNHLTTSRFKLFGFIRGLKCLVFLVSILFCHPAIASEKSADLLALQDRIIRLVPNGCVQLNNETGQTLFSYRTEDLLIPASLIKILTALVAFEELGIEYRFKTEFYVNDRGDLAIKGWGDPFLISEEIDLITSALVAKGLRKVNRLYLDTTSFQKNIRISGLSNSQNPYDALNGALVVNFNSLFIGRNLQGNIYSAEAVTPLTPLALIKGQHLKPGEEERFNLTIQADESLQYVGELFLAKFNNRSIQVKDPKIGEIAINGSWRLLYAHFNSHDLTSIVDGLLRYSNNYIANQIFLAIGLHRGQPPANLEKSRHVFRRYLNEKYGQSISGTVVDEASGISKLNRMSCGTLMKFLEDFRKHASLIQLKKGIRVKSGTLTGIYNYAGYFQSNQGLQPFVIMSENRRNNRDRALELLNRYIKIQQRLDSD